MRKSVLAALPLLMVITHTSLAADLPPRPAPFQPYAPARLLYDWTGFYVGGNVGGGSANTKSDFSAGGLGFATANNNLTGVLGGAQAGYNWQTGPAVFGVETDFQFSSLKGSINAPGCPAAICGVALSASYTQKMPWFGTVRGRLGYAADTWMIYATGGYAYARLESDATASAGGATVGVSHSETRGGWTAGAGIEVAFAPHWTAKLEYLYLDFGTRDSTWAFTGLPTVNDHSRVYDNLVRAGVNYRF